MKFYLKTIAIIAIIVVVIAIFIFIKQEAQWKDMSHLQSVPDIYVDPFNEQFDIYEGIQKGYDVKELISRVIVSNINNENDMLVSVNNKNTTDELKDILAGVLKEKTYKVILIYNDKGKVSGITLEML